MKWEQISDVFIYLAAGKKSNPKQRQLVERFYFNYANGTPTWFRSETKKIDLNSNIYVWKFRNEMEWMAIVPICENKSNVNIRFRWRFVLLGRFDSAKQCVSIEYFDAGIFKWQSVWNSRHKLKCILQRITQKLIFCAKCLCESSSSVNAAYIIHSRSDSQTWNLNMRNSMEYNYSISISKSLYESYPKFYGNSSSD